VLADVVKIKKYTVKIFSYRALYIMGRLYSKNIVEVKKEVFSLGSEILF
jgi:hypothetical protein